MSSIFVEQMQPNRGAQRLVVLAGRQLTAKRTRHEGRLPPVLPLVLYNGQHRWSAATELLELIEPAPGRLRDDAPRLRYLLLDEGTIDESAPWALRCYPKAIV